MMDINVNLLQNSSDTNKETGVNSNRVSKNKQLPKDLHKPITRKFDKRKVFSSFKDKLWGADLSDIQLIRKFN